MAANEEKLVRKVYAVNSKKYPQKLISIPNSSDIEAGDYVEIKKVH